MANSNEDTTVSIVLPKRMLKELSDFAKKNDCSVSALIRRIVREWQNP
jgi:metal-responsive CopG/Arc/MetJ family transcriptional regulator